MTPSFDLFDFGASRRAYISSADQETAGYLSALSGVSVDPFKAGSGKDSSLFIDSNELLAMQIGSR